MWLTDAQSESLPNDHPMTQRTIHPERGLPPEIGIALVTFGMFFMFLGELELEGGGFVPHPQGECGMRVSSSRRSFRNAMSFFWAQVSCCSLIKDYSRSET
jgi:hypothetical protein